MRLPRSTFLRNVLAYSGTNFVSQASRLVQAFAIRRILPPNVLGPWNFALLVQDFMGTFDLGLMEAAARELPILHGAGARHEEARCRSTAFWSKLAQSVGLAVAVVVYAVVFSGRYTGVDLVALVAAAVMIVLASLKDSITTFYQSTERYVVLSKLLLVCAVVYATLLPAGALVSGILGLVVAGVLYVAFQAVVMLRGARQTGLAISWTWDRDTFWRLIGFGLPLRLVDYPHQWFGLADMLFVTKFMGTEALAIYATARAVIGQAQDVITRVSVVMMVRIFKLSGRHASRPELGAELMRFLLVGYLVLVPVVIVTVAAVSSFVIRYLIPKYAMAVPVIDILLFVIYFTPQTSLLRTVWMLDKRLLALGTSNVIGLATAAVTLFAASTLAGFRLEAVALATVVYYAVYFGYLLAVAGRDVLGTRKALEFAGCVALSVTYTGLIVRFMHTAGPAGSLDLVAGALSALVGALGSIALLAPLIWLGMARSHCLAYLRQARR